MMQKEKGIFKRHFVAWDELYCPFGDCTRRTDFCFWSSIPIKIKYLSQKFSIFFRNTMNVRHPKKSVLNSILFLI